MCLAQGHNMLTPVGIEPRTSRFGVRRSTTTPQRSLGLSVINIVLKTMAVLHKYKGAAKGENQLFPGTL